MSTAVPITSTTIQGPVDTVESLQMSVTALKQNIEILQGTRGIVRANALHGPTIVNTQTSAALRAVQSTYP